MTYTYKDEDIRIQRLKSKASVDLIRKIQGYALDAMVELYAEEVNKNDRSELR